MNNTFDIKRFGLLMKRDLAQDWKKYALQVAALLGVMLCFPIYYTYTKYDNLERYANKDIVDFFKELNHSYLMMAIVLFVIAFLIYVSAMMSPISSKRKRTDYLILPCSSLEKYLSRFLIHVVGFVAVFFICLFVADCIRMGIFSIAYPEIGVKAIDFGMLVENSFFNKPMVLVMVSTMLMSVAAFFTLGATFWQRYIVVKNVVSLFAIILLFVGFVRLLLSILDRSKFGNHNIQFEGEEAFIIPIIIFGSFSLFFWILGYFRFKETELINRW